ncbi:MAG: DUF2726 domain-containing protein [Ectothiorhodospira sp.]
MVEAILVLIFAGAAVTFYTQYNARVAVPPPQSGCYERQEAVLSGKEAEVFKALEAEYGGEHRVLAKVGADDVVAVKPTPEQPLMEAARERVRGEKFDFVLCGTEDFDVTCAIRCRSKEGKGLVHDPDRFLEEVCEHIEVPLALIRTDQAITQAGVKARVDEAVKGVKDRAKARRSKKTPASGKGQGRAQSTARSAPAPAPSAKGASPSTGGDTTTAPAARTQSPGGDSGPAQGAAAQPAERPDAPATPSGSGETPGGGT